MGNKFYRKREPLRKNSQCSCGSEAKLIKRRNFPHGRKSGGISYQVYRCESCKKETPAN